MTITLSPQKVYDNLTHLEEVDAVRGASYRKQAFEVLTNPNVNPSWKQAIGDRLNQSNRLLALLTVEPDESY